MTETRRQSVDGGTSAQRIVPAPRERVPPQRQLPSEGGLGVPACSRAGCLEGGAKGGGGSVNQLYYQHHSTGNDFHKTLLLSMEEDMSQYQMSLYLDLLLGLLLSALLASFSVRPCGKTHDFHGYNWLGSTQNAALANRAPHYFVQFAVKKEFQHLGLHLVDNDNETRQRFTHFS
jgi:hypothetical protein